MNTVPTKRYFTENGIVALKADKTTEAPEIDELLKVLKNKTTQIPFYAVFPETKSTGSQRNLQGPIEVETYDGLFFSSSHFLSEIGNLESKPLWKSPLLWGIVAGTCGLGALVFFRRRQITASSD